jgi:hypothetical protein
MARKHLLPQPINNPSWADSLVGVVVGGSDSTQEQVCLDAILDSATLEFKTSRAGNSLSRPKTASFTHSQKKAARISDFENTGRMV